MNKLFLVLFAAVLSISVMGETASVTVPGTVNVGGGWGALSRPNRIVATPLLAYHMETDTVDITVSDNVFEKVSGQLMFVLGGVESLDPGYRIFRNMVK